MAEPSLLESVPCDCRYPSEDGVPDAVERARIWGLPLARVSIGQTLDLIGGLIRRGEPSLVITANLNYAMLSDGDPRVAEVNRLAALLVADGMPMIWYSRLTRQPLPERVTGADLIHLLCRQAAERGQRVFFLGGRPGMAAAAATKLSWMYPGLEVAGVEAPELDVLSASEHEQLVGRIRDARPDLLFVALGQPKGEIWLAKNLRELRVPVSIQVGASFDFVAGQVARAPRWMQRIGLEWLYRMGGDPKRLGPRYAKNAWFLAKAIFRDAITFALRRQAI
jgi:N-acetylglucosaminyldiphosphoundecaprenol N-acetyl-beta-D-mannosaminyltransferase